jgi:hypothetical protein
MLMCHECYKIALFCGLSPPLDKSRTIVTVCDTATEHVHNIEAQLNMFTVTIWQMIVQGTGLTHITIWAIMGFSKMCQWPYQRLPAKDDVVSFTGEILSVNQHDLLVAVDDIAYFLCPFSEEEDMFEVD